MKLAFMMAVDGHRFMTKTQHYRKVTKPLLERKRRARMNLYLDELKDLIVDTMEAQGEHVTKLEKADILEMTVQYLKTHKHEIAASAAQEVADTSGGGLNVEKFRAGYTQAAYEVSKVFATLPGLDLKFGTRLLQHLGYQLKDIKQASSHTRAEAADTDDVFVKPTSTAVARLHGGRNEAQQRDIRQQPLVKEELQPKGEDVWRPW